MAPSSGGRSKPRLTLGGRAGESLGPQGCGQRHPFTPWFSESQDNAPGGMEKPQASPEDLSSKSART